MATDATGTPTSLGIPKYNTNTDAPSGKGFNAAMDAIDALIAARVTKPSGIAAGEVPVWNGSAFVRSTTTRIGISSIASGTPDGTKFVRDDGTLVTPGLTTLNLADAQRGTSLPGSPADGDIFMLVDSATAATYQWLFRYESGSTNADKWEFIGGVPIVLSDDPNVANSTLTQVGATGFYYKASTLSFTTPRAGVYRLIGGGFYDNAGDANNPQVGLFNGSTLLVSQGGIWNGASAAFDSTSGHIYPYATLGATTASIAASTAIGIAAGTASKKQRLMHVSIVPVRVS